MSADTARATRPGGAALVDRYEALLCDLDGVVYRGRDALPGAGPTLRRVVAHGVRLAYVTNNASRPPEAVAAQLRDLGAPTPPGSVVTSAQAGAAHLGRLLQVGAAVVALGGAGVQQALEEEHLLAVPATRREAAAVLQGYGPDLRVSDFTEAARHVSTGVPWVATNADATVPVEWGVAPGNGSYVDVLRRATGREPVVVGKPEPPLYELAIARVGTRRVLAVGDRLDTDIDGARAAGVDSAWTLTGVDRPSDLVADPDRALPTFVIGGLADLERPYAVPVPTGGGAWACGGAEASVQLVSGTARLVLSLASRPPALAAVRAGLAALLEARARDRSQLPALVAAAASLDALVDAVVDAVEG